MKKSTTVLTAIIGAIGISLFSGCGGKNTFTENNYSSADAIINSVVLDVSDREVEVTQSQDEQIHICYFESEKEYYSISEAEGILKMSVVFNKDWTDYIGLKTDIQYRKIKIEIPENFISDLSITTTNEKIEVTNLIVKESISLNSDGGNLEFENLSAGKSISLTAKNSDITGSVSGGWDDYTIKVTIKKGKSNLISKEGGEKLLTADCNNGDINIDLIK